MKLSVLLVVSLLTSLSISAKELGYANYLKMQDALAKDNFEQALDSWKTICTKELNGLVKSMEYNDCGQPMKNIKQLRDSFKVLSEIYIKEVKATKNQSLVVARCPMANARWLQKNGSISNPYYGKEMLQCGQIEK